MVLSDKLPKPNYGHKSVSHKKSIINFNINNYKNYNTEQKTISNEMKKMDEKVETNNFKKENEEKVIVDYKGKISSDNITNSKNQLNKNKSFESSKNNLPLTKNIAKSVSKGELPAIKQITMRNDKYKEDNKNQNNVLPYSCKSDDGIGKKNKKIFNILSKKNLIRVNQINKLYRPYVNQVQKNNGNAIININSNIFNNRGNKSIDNYRDNIHNKIPNKIRLIPIKKTLLNIS